MFILGKINYLLSRYNLGRRGQFSAWLVRPNSMLTIQRYLRWALLGLIIVLTASINLFCIVIDNDDDGDPTTGVTIEFHVVPGKRVQVAASLVHVQSTLASNLFGSVFFSR